jgi:monomeric sarcosine oxidase
MGEIVHQQHVVIVGAGIIGLSTAYALLKQGLKRVTILEQYSVDHALSTSRGMSRLLRFEYGTDLFYSQLVRLALARWRELEYVTKRTLYTRTGLLSLGNEGDNVTLPGHLALREMGVASEILSRRDCNERFPQFHIQPYDLFTYSREGGILHASYCLRTLKELVLAMGGRLCESCSVTGWSGDGGVHQPLRLRLHSGDECEADRVVLAIGPWAHRLLGRLQLPVRVTRQYLLYFANVPSTLFNLHTFPAFMADDLYGFPLHSTGCGPDLFKAASHAFGDNVIDLDGTPVIDEQVITTVTAQLKKLLPDLRSADLAHVDACMYDVSADENFILDYLPWDPRIIFASGLSGHAFKFGLLLGELLGNMVCATESIVPLERFSLARFENMQVSSMVSAGSII